jgi:hypothetical protein
MRNAIRAALLLFTSVSLFSQTTPLKTEQHKAAHTIIMTNRATGQGAGCSATAISEHVLLTAKHCDIAGGLLYLDQTAAPLVHPLKISDKIMDHQDHMLLVVPGVTFKNFVHLGLSAKPLQSGEHYYLWGNPALIADQYREGYVTGTVTPAADSSDSEELDVISPFVMLSGPVVGGDSGSGIYGGDGRLCGVLTYGIYGGAFAGVYPITFTPDQLAQALGIGTFVYEPEVVPPTVVVIAAPAAAPIISPLVGALLVVALFIYICTAMLSTLRRVASVLHRVFTNIGRAALRIVRITAVIYATIKDI